jgi:hypothetical protein
VTAPCVGSRLEARFQIGDFAAQLGDLSTVVHELDGEAVQREAKSLGASFGADPRQVWLVVTGHVSVVQNARCIGRLTVVNRADASAAQVE